MGKFIRYGISKLDRTFTPTPIVIIEEDDKGKEKETLIMCAFGKKKKGDELSKKIVELLNSNQ